VGTGANQCDFRHGHGLARLGTTTEQADGAGVVNTGGRFNHRSDMRELQAGAEFPSGARSASGQGMQKIVQPTAYARFQCGRVVGSEGHDLGGDTHFDVSGLDNPQPSCNRRRHPCAQIVRNAAFQFRRGRGPNFCGSRDDDHCNPAALRLSIRTGDGQAVRTCDFG